MNLINAIASTVYYRVMCLTTTMMSLMLKEDDTYAEGEVCLRLNCLLQIDVLKCRFL
jgi:hypothetical protein